MVELDATGFLAEQRLRDYDRARSAAPVEGRSLLFTQHKEAPMVKAMFYVNHVGKNASGVGIVRLNATTKGDYAAWSKYTPAGQIEINSLNEDATAWFEERLGKDVALSFDDPTEADAL